MFFIFIRVYLIFFFYCLIFYFLLSFDFLINYVYNYLLYLHIVLIFSSYLFLFLFFLFFFFSYFGFYWSVVDFKVLNLIYLFYTLVIGSLWAYSLWRSFLFFDVRTLFILVLFFYFLFDLLFPLFISMYKGYFFFFFFIHLFIIKLKLNWSSQIHQTNSFFFFLYYFNLIDLFTLVFLFLFTCGYCFFVYILGDLFIFIKKIQLKNI